MFEISCHVSMDKGIAKKGTLFSSHISGNPTTMLSSRVAPGEIDLSPNKPKPIQLAVRGLLQRFVVRIIFILQ
jgi:hypothetical protein